MAFLGFLSLCSTSFPRIFTGFFVNPIKSKYWRAATIEIVRRTHKIPKIVIHIHVITPTFLRGSLPNAKNTSQSNKKKTENDWKMYTKQFSEWAFSAVTLFNGPHNHKTGVDVRKHMEKPINFNMRCRNHSSLLLLCLYHFQTGALIHVECTFVDTPKFLLCYRVQDLWVIKRVIITYSSLIPWNVIKPLCLTFTRTIEVTWTIIAGAGMRTMHFGDCGKCCDVLVAVGCHSRSTDIWFVLRTEFSL